MRAATMTKFCRSCIWSLLRLPEAALYLTSWRESIVLRFATSRTVKPSLMWRNHFQKESEESHYRDIHDTITYNARLTCVYIYALFIRQWNSLASIYKNYTDILVEIYFLINALLLFIVNEELQYMPKNILLKY